MDLPLDKKASQGKIKALELTEDSREQEWNLPSFVAELFEGKVHWDLLMPFPKQSDEDKKIGDEFLAKLEKTLKEHVDPEKVDKDQEVPPSAIKALVDIGAFGMKIPKKYGGLEFSQVNYNRAIHLVSSYCSSTAIILSAHQSIGVPQPLIHFGTEAQRKKYLPELVKGKISAFALTEPEVGSDPARMKTTATPTEDGKYYVLNGEKLWCTNGSIADVIVVMAKTPPKIIRGKERQQITTFIVEKSMPGVEIAHQCEFMGVRGIANALIRFNDVKVPKENMVGEEGKGLKQALSTLNIGRLTMPVAVLAPCKWCIRVMRDWANRREQWGSPIGKHEAVATKIAEVTAFVFAMDAMGFLAASLVDQKKSDIRLEAAIAKMFCTEAGWKIVDETFQVRGGRAYETADSLRKRGDKPYAIEKLMRDMRINMIIEGTSQIMRLFIAREAMDMHVRKIMPIVARRTKLMDRFKLAWEAFLFYAGWYPRQYLFRVLIPKNVSIPGRLRPHMKYVEKTSHRLARNLFHVMMIYQQGLEKKQQVMSRLMDVGADLFAMATCCSKAVQMSSDDPADRGPAEIADLFCRQARERIQKNFRELFRNHDRFAYKIAQNTLKDRYLWLENDIAS